MKFTLAAAQYPIDQLPDWAAYIEKLTRWVREAADGGASLAVFPEYGAMELAALHAETMDDLADSIAFVAALGPHVDALHMELARQHNIHILAASMPALRDGRYHNAARLFSPSGAVGVQEKQLLPAVEQEQWHIAPGGPLHVFECDLGKIGVLIGYDSEFPLPGRALAEAGAELLLVPSRSDTLAGYQRQRIGARARSLEAQCYVVQAPTVWNAEWSPAVAVNRGAAGIYAPPGSGFPESGIVAQGTRDRPEWVFGDIDLSLIGRARQESAERNFAQWPAQTSSGVMPQVEHLHL